MKVEYLILMALLAVIALLLQDRYRRERSSKTDGEQQAPDYPDIMGKPRSEGQAVQMEDSSGHEGGQGRAVDNFTTENHQGHPTDAYVGPEGERGALPDLEEEEEEWMGYGLGGVGDGFATGVTFEELGAAGTAISGQDPEASLSQAKATVQKIDGTDLLTLLESALGDSARKLAILLDRTAPGPADLQDDAHRDFDIGDFV
ncbi:hypothetical protein D3C87_405760 [compost metagenome]